MTKEKLMQQYFLARYYRYSTYIGEMKELHEEVVEWINNVDDCVVREVLRQRYILGKSWVGVAAFFGYLNHSDAYRKKAERYIEKNTDKAERK